MLRRIIKQILNVFKRKQCIPPTIWNARHYVIHIIFPLPTIHKKQHEVFVKIMTMHTYLSISLFTDKGTAFASKLIGETALKFRKECQVCTNRTPTNIRQLGELHASVKTNINIASGENGRYWQCSFVKRHVPRAYAVNHSGEPFPTDDYSIAP